MSETCTEMVNVEFAEMRQRILDDPEGMEFFQNELGGSEDRLRRHMEECARRVDRIFPVYDSIQILLAQELPEETSK